MDKPNNSDPLYNQVLDKFTYHVPTYITSIDIRSNILIPIYNFLKHFDYNLNNVNLVDLIILDKDPADLVLATNSNGFNCRRSRHRYIITIRDIEGCIESILHEVMHVIDEELDHNLMNLQKKLFEYNLRYYEIRAFSHSKVSFALQKITRNITKDEKMVIHYNLDKYRIKLAGLDNELFVNYSQNDKFNLPALYHETAQALTDGAEMINACMKSVRDSY